NVPVIQGHEFSGTIREVGKKVKGWKLGDRVTSETHAYVCGECIFCKSGEVNLCPDRLGFGYGTNGAFAKFVKVPARILHRLPENVPFEHAALTEPACVSYNAIVVKSELRPGEPLMVIGPGPIGLFAVQMARISGAAPIALVGTQADAKRLEIGKKLGATHTFVADREDAANKVMELTNGLGVPLIIDAAGRSKAVELALATVRRSGQITKVGWGPQPLGLSLDPLLSKAARLQGTFSHTYRTWEAVLALMSAGEIRMEPMISHTFPVSEWHKAYELVDKREAVKVVLVPE
ncbi:MAG: zinc-binding dehydrogenase, partial [Planctomycetota bacterium]